MRKKFKIAITLSVIAFILFDGALIFNYPPEALIEIITDNIVADKMLLENIKKGSEQAEALVAEILSIFKICSGISSILLEIIAIVFAAFGIKEKIKEKNNEEINDTQAMNNF